MVLAVPDWSAFHCRTTPFWWVPFEQVNPSTVVPEISPHSVASLVVARDGLPDRRYYRHFKIKTVEGADDPRSMAEVVRRRYGPASTLLETSPRADLFKRRRTRRPLRKACGQQDGGTQTDNVFFNVHGTFRWRL